MKSAILRTQGGYNRENSVGVLSGGLTMEHVCDKESDIVVQNKVNNVILTQKEKRALRNRRNRLKNKNVDGGVKKKRLRMRELYNRDNNADKIKQDLKQLYNTFRDLHYQKKDCYEENKKNQRKT